MRTEFERVQAAVGTLEESQKDLFRAVKDCWPIGCTASYKHGENVIFVEVTGYGCGDRIKVHNKQTDRRYWVSFYRFIPRK